MVPPTSRRPPPPGPAFSERFRSKYGSVRGTYLAIALSALVHLVGLVVLLLAPGFSGTEAPRAVVPDWLIELTRPLGVERFIILERPEPRIAVAPPASAPSPVELPAFVQPAPELVAPEPSEAAPGGAMVGAEAAEPEPAGGVDAGGAGTGPRTAAERLRPGEKDPRLWFILPEEIVGLSPEQRLQLEMALAVRAMGDSAAAAAAMASAFTDWTYVDDEGRRWGFSPGQLHLGDITIPLPFGFEPPPNSLAARRTQQDAAIAAQAARQEVRQTLRDRAAEIRRRRDAERARARGDTAAVNR
jgi:hypothetical protein